MSVGDDCAARVSEKGRGMDAAKVQSCWREGSSSPGSVGKAGWYEGKVYYVQSVLLTIDRALLEKKIRVKQSHKVVA